MILVASVPVQAEVINNAAEYRNCLALARTQPEAGFEKALSWQSLGGGDAARHCVAVALIGLEKFEEAARRLEALAQASRREESLRAEMLAQAGQAWLLANNFERAYAAQTAALKLRPNDPDLLIDRAQSLAGAKNYWEAIDDLNQAISLAPNRVEALVFRAAAYRYVDSEKLAREDVERALKLAPDNTEALLERGILFRLAGKPDDARRDWIKILSLAPASATADAARRNIELLDVRVME
ncbi:MAG: tetratricopeptide repeat protein [Alphaproteobacteria bacterium]|nr:tetratricopeptide repeat protein [Alphaproteobacteria bacterium]